MKKPPLILAASAVSLVLTACSSSSGNGDGNGGSNDTRAVVTPLVSFPITDGAIKARIQEDADERGYTLDEYSIQIGDKTYKDGNGIDLKEFGMGTNVLSYKDTLKTTHSDGRAYTQEETYGLYLFQQKYSSISGLELESFVLKNANGEIIAQDKQGDPSFNESFDITIKGDATKTLPATGKFNYVGDAWFDGKTKGKLSYAVDFGAKSGSGQVTGHKDGIIDLLKASIDNMPVYNDLDDSKIEAKGILGKAAINGKEGEYRLRFFGPNAEEMMGEVDLDRTAGIHGFIGGTKQAK